ncbi:DEAD/DEAH box helicase [Tabrizicola sp.]|uniref:DEAD/DEAH box helicase n=1 Tax=Tabrizicola sp. TaxID=2005166 RepID=UPI0027332937|nr:DEAD/DEAH box helicase family protein [Tabrizicola sp.]MDP3196666.1 DEAD/DEAH box helicase family protein [Tabrizicola sp.]
MPGLKAESYKYIEFLTSPDDDQAARTGTLWPHQWESFLRVVYAHEVLGKTQIGADGLLLNIVTGGGKTAVIAALVAWLRIAHNVQKFVLLCPNLIVRDRLEDDFQGGKVFKNRSLIPDWASAIGQFDLTTLGSGKAGGWSSLFSSSVILGNIHQFYLSNKSGQSNLSALMNGPDFALFNDEAHNSPAPEYDATLLRMREKVVLRVDTTATPDRADGRTPDSEMVYEYGVTDALHDGIIKTPVVYQPDIKTVQLTYTDARTGEKRKVEEIDWEEVDRLGLSATQWVTDDEPMRQQMAIALKRLEEQERRAKGRYQPILFVVAVCKADAEKAEQTLNKYFRVKTLLVTEDSDEADRQKARELGRQQKTGKPYKAVVSVLMLREGWDVPEVGVILLLRKFGSRVYGQQVIGRGLRRVRVKGVEPNEPQICAVVDHPKLEHQWLWDIFNARKREGVLIDDLFDETEDLPPPPPKQEFANPDLVIDVPPVDPSFVDDGEFDLGDFGPPPQPMENWKEAMDAIEYDPTVVEITKLGISGVVGQELGKEGWKTIHSAPDPSTPGGAGVQISDEAIRDAVKMGMLEIAEALTVEAGYAATFKDRVYSALVQHIRKNFLNGASLGLADRTEVDYAWKMLRQVKPKVGAIPGLIAGIIEYGD